MVPARPVPASCRAPARLLLAVFALAALLTGTHARADTWPDFKDDLKIAKPQVDPEADAEVLLWQIKVRDVENWPSYHSDISQYRRIKIFTDRGKEIAGQFAIPYRDKANVEDLEARTIRPDGSVVDVARNAFYKRTKVKESGRKVNVISFAFPSVERGCIVECRWTERQYEVTMGELTLSPDIPVRSTELWVCPIEDERYQYQLRSFNMQTPYFEDVPEKQAPNFRGSLEARPKAQAHFRKAVLPPMEATRQEPFMPPEHLVNPWMVFSYRFHTDPPPERFWSEYVRQEAEEVGRRTRADASVKQKAAELAAGAASDDQKLDRLHDFCRTKIHNIDEDAVGETNAAEEKASRSPAETLRRSAGGDEDIDYLFAALAGALGFEVRIARTSDRREYLFDPTFQLKQTLDELCVAVRRGPSWRYFHPAARYVPAGVVPWWEEGQQAILIDPTKESFESLPVSPPDSNRIEGKGRFRLLADGTLEGDASEAFTGQWSASMKEKLDHVSSEKRNEDLKNALLEQYPGAAVDSVRVEHASDADGTPTRSYHIRIPGYATRSGTRLLVPSEFFQTGAKPVLERPDRHNPIYFDFPDVRSDEVRIDLPESFELESSPDAGPFAVPGFVRLESSVQAGIDGKSLRLTRTEWRCENREIAFPASQYPTIKAAFDRMRELDGGIVALRLTGQASGR
jgi:uncharacterized protein DUF3857